MSESINLDDMLHRTDMSISLTPHEREHLVFSTLRGGMSRVISSTISPREIILRSGLYFVNTQMGSMVSEQFVVTFPPSLTDASVRTAKR